MDANRVIGWPRLGRMLGRKWARTSQRAQRARAAYRPDVDALERRQLLTSYKFLTRASFSALEGQPGSLVMDARGDIFGTTSGGGTAGDGTLFELAKGARRPRTLASFSDASSVVGSLVLDNRGDIFGMTQQGGASNDGTIFELARGARKIAVLASFGLGQGGEALVPRNLVRDSQGNLYGTAISRYGDPEGSGIIFELPAGSHSISTVYSFQTFFNGPAPPGSQPDLGLAVDAHGDLFGTYFVNGVALQPSLNPHTFLFELPKGSDTVTSLATINGNADAPVDGLVLAKNGTLYGVNPGDAAAGGTDDGSVFSYVAGSGASTATTRASFHGNDGASPSGNPVVDAHGNVFGTTGSGGPDFNPPRTLGYGTVYEIAAGSNSVTSLVGFNLLDGFSPYDLVADNHGDLFGVVQTGTTDNIFELAVVPTPRMRR